MWITVLQHQYKIISNILQYSLPKNIRYNKKSASFFSFRYECIQIFRYKCFDETVPCYTLLPIGHVYSAWTDKVKRALCKLLFRRYSIDFEHFLAVWIVLKFVAPWLIVFLIVFRRFFVRKKSELREERIYNLTKVL